MFIAILNVANRIHVDIIPGLAAGKYDMVVDYVRAYSSLSAPSDLKTTDAGGVVQGLATDEHITGGAGSDTLMAGAGTW